MKSRIIFLDDEPQTSGRLREALEGQGYTVCAPRTVEEVFHEINVNRAELIVHCAHRTKTHWDVCDSVFRKYPQFPSIHFATGPSADLHNLNFKSPFHLRLRPLVPEREFLRRVKKLIFLGRLQRENQALKKALDLQDKMDKVFDTLDLNELKCRMVDFFCREFQARNGFFLSSGGYGYYIQQMWKISVMNGGQDRGYFKHALVSAHPSTEDELSNYLNEVAEKLPSGWEFRKIRTYIPSWGPGHHSYCFVPLFGHQSKTVQGYIVLVDPLLYGDLALEKALPNLTKVLGRHLEHTMTFAEAKGMSYIDDVTDLYNQRYLKLVLDKEINRCQRTNGTFSVLFMDIDHFKQVNDAQGHRTGSQILVEVSKILNQNIRAMDYGFRYGGDEFLLILVGTGSAAALQVAERIRKQVEESFFEVEGSKIQVTLSIGIATFPEHATTKEQIIELADRAMYCGKNESRNVVYVAS